MCINKRTIPKVRDNNRTITREEEAKIVALLRGTEINQRKPYYSDIADLVEVMINTGLRQLESLELMNRDVDFESNLITVRVTKGPHHRRIPMTKRVAAIMKRRQEIDQLKPFNLTTMQISMAWSWLRTQMGLKDDKGFVLYALRRTCVTRMKEARIDMEIVQEILTSRCRTSNRRFAPTPLHKLNNAAELLEEWLK